MGLARAYKQRKAKLCEVVRMLLLADIIEIGHRDAAWRALHDSASGKADFPDYLIGAIKRDKCADITLTFDRSVANGNRAFRSYPSSIALTRARI